MAELRVPKLNTNDSEYLLVEWLVQDGDSVHEDDLVALVETSKAAEELPADATGVLRHRVAAGAWCRPDQVIATIGGDAAVARPEPASPPAAAGRPEPSAARDGLPLVTAPAQAFADEHGVTGEQLRELGLKVVRKADLERLLGHVRDLPKAQRAVARAVELSHSTIPAAYLAVRMDLAGAIEHAKAETRTVRRPIGLAEIFVQAVAGLHERFPLFFATLEGDRIRLSRTADIGVTLDLGEGLYVPVLHDAGGRTTKELASALMRHRLAATTGDFRPSDLSGANFVVTLHTEGGVVMAIPFVFPGTACALAVTAPGQDGGADIGLAYDHRLINGREAALFMHALKAAVEGLS